jgi:hypothetical protein
MTVVAVVAAVAAAVVVVVVVATKVAAITVGTKRQEDAQPLQPDGGGKSLETCPEC